MPISQRCRDRCASRSALPRSLVALATLLGASSSARAVQGTPPDVAVVASDFGITEVANRLQATGLFGQVVAYDVQSFTPTLAQLSNFDAVLTWTYSNYHDAVQLGNVLADYSDQHGGVVVAALANVESTGQRYLQGRWLTGGYEVVAGQGGLQTGAATLGNVHFPTHPLMSGVTSFDGGGISFRPASVAVTSGSRRIAEWSDGKTLVALHGTIPGRVDLGFYPVSMGGFPGSWELGTDGSRLTTNALLFAAASNYPPFCSGDSSAAACPCANSGLPARGCASSVNLGGARLRTFGIATLGADTLSLRGSGMTNSTALYIQGSTQAQGGSGIVFGDGLRCVGGNILRLGSAQNSGGYSLYPAAGNPSVSQRGLVTAPGTRTYQVWYRDAAPFCTPSTFNLTNGVVVTWTN